MFFGFGSKQEHSNNAVEFLQYEILSDFRDLLGYCKVNENIIGNKL